MKRIITLITAFVLLITTQSFAAFTESKTEQKEAYGAFKNAETKAAAEVFANMSRKDYEQLTGKHLNLMERLAFKVTQKKVKQQLIATQQTFGFNIGGFMLGLLLIPIGVLLAYAFSSDTNVRKWAWIGAVISLIVILIIAL